MRAQSSKLRTVNPPISPPPLASLGGDRPEVGQQEGAYWRIYGICKYIQIEIRNTAETLRIAYDVPTLHQGFAIKRRGRTLRR